MNSRRQPGLSYQGSSGRAKRAAAALLLVCALSAGAGSATPGKATGIAAPEVFAPDVVSTGKEFGLAFMPDGKEAYFTRFDPVKRTNHIMRTVLVNGQWQPPAEIEFSRDEWRDLDPALTPDGKRLFFVSTRPKPGSDPATPGKDMDIWFSDREGNAWGAPHWVENINSEGKEGSPSIARDGTLYFFSDRGAAANSNSIYSAKLVNGRYSAPEKLPAEINSGVSDTSPFIAPDGNTLLFYSSRPGGYGKGDLYVAFKKHGRWTPAVNLGSTVNTEESEYNPSVSRDGERLYFGRKSRIYELPLKAVGLKSLQPKLFR